MYKSFVFLLVAFLIASCDGANKAWSPVARTIDGRYKITGTLGLSLSLGESGQLQFTLGPAGSLLAPASVESKQDAALLGLAVGQWTLEKGTTKVILPRGSDGYVQSRNLYENFAPDLWSVLSSPGCATLVTFTEGFDTSSGAVVQRTYRICDVDKAVQALRK